MSEWDELTIGELPLIIGDGNYSSKYPSAKEFKVAGIPFISNKDIKNGRILSEDLRYISPEKHAELKKGHIKEHDILVSTRANIGDIAYVDASFEDANINAQLVFLRCDEKKLHSKFLYHLLSSKHYHSIFQNHASGSAQMQLPISALRDIPISFPEYDEQKAIAGVLSSLDDKIDLLHRQNKTLEAMAATLFRQWFVEQAQEDWEEVALEDVTRRITDGAHASPSTVEVGLPMASVKDMYQWGINTASCRQISQENFNELVRTDCRPLKNDILIAKDGSYLKHVFVAEDDMDVVILSSIAILRPNKKYHPLLLATFLKLDSTREGLANIVTGAVIPRIVLKDFRKYKLLLPPKQLQDQALTSIQPIYEKCWENDRQIRTLENLRDTLLPVPLG